ncbi:MAG: acetoacetate decarboxylase family protein [Myxococcales bacterium]|nr:acetoacetate decarboxylase family protein [Myxococcales bacterium]
MSTALPIVYRKARAWIAGFPAPTRELAKLLPDARLDVIEVRPGTSVLVAAAFEYVDTSIGPYLEAALSIPCRWGRHLRVPLLPLMAERWLGDVGHWVQLLPVTTSAADVAGRTIWGYPKFVGDIQVDAGPSHMRCRVSEAGQLVFGFEVERPGPSRPMRFPVRTYSRLDDEIHFTEIDVDAVGCRKTRGARGSLELSGHPRLAGLPPPSRIRPTPLEVRWFDEYRLELDRASTRYRIPAR